MAHPFLPMMAVFAIASAHPVDLNAKSKDPISLSKANSELIFIAGRDGPADGDDRTAMTRMTRTATALNPRKKCRRGIIVTTTKHPKIPMAASTRRVKVRTGRERFPGEPRPSTPRTQVALRAPDPLLVLKSLCDVYRHALCAGDRTTRNVLN
jgi:hypothetical protein